MKKTVKKILAVATATCLCVPMLTGCSSRLAEQSKIYFNSIKNVIDQYLEYNEIMNNLDSSSKRENALDKPANFAIADGNYSFDSVEKASYYMLSVYETSGSLDAVGSLKIESDGSKTYTGSMADVESAKQSNQGGMPGMPGMPGGGDAGSVAKMEYSYGEWYVRVVAYPAEDSTLEQSDAAFTTYAVKGAVTNGSISNQYVWNVCTGDVTLTLNGFDYAKTAYPTNVKVTLTNKSTQAKVSVDTGKLTSSSVSVDVKLPVSTANYDISLDCEWDETYVTNPSWTTTAGEIAVDATKSLKSEGLSYTCGIFSRFEFPFVYEGFNPAAIPTDKAYKDVALEEGIVFGTSTASNNECTFRAYPIWSEKGYEGKDGAIYSFDVRIKGTSAITASPRKSPGSGSTNIIFGQLDFFADGTFELELEYQYIKTDAMNAGVYYVPGVICEGVYHVENDGTYTLSYDYINAYETKYEPVEELNGKASFYSEIDPEWKANQGGGGNPGGGGGGFEFVFGTYTWNTADNSFQLKAGEHILLNFTATKNATATAGSTYSFTLATNDTGAPFAIDCTLELKEDGTAVYHCGAAGPLADTVKTGTWTEADGVVTIVLG